MSMPVIVILTIAAYFLLLMLVGLAPLCYLEASVQK